MIIGGHKGVSFFLLVTYIFLPFLVVMCPYLIFSESYIPTFVCLTSSLQPQCIIYTVSFTCHSVFLQYLIPAHFIHVAFILPLHTQ